MVGGHYDPDWWYEFRCESLTFDPDWYRINLKGKDSSTGKFDTEIRSSKTNTLTVEPGDMMENR
jgi:hypothetical protein